jgi:hypothetical protein
MFGYTVTDKLDQVPVPLGPYRLLGSENVMGPQGLKCSGLKQPVDSPVSTLGDLWPFNSKHVLPFKQTQRIYL